jgi:hypothetical protein
MSRMLSPEGLNVLGICAVIQAIKSNDDWAELVLRRLPKLKGRIKQPGRVENTLAIAAGLDIRQRIKNLKLIEDKIS